MSGYFFTTALNMSANRGLPWNWIVNMSSIFQEHATIMQELKCLQKALCEFVSNPDHFTDPNDPDAAAVFLSQSWVRLYTLGIDESFPTLEEAQQWLDEITSSRDFRRKYNCPRRVILLQKDSGKPWPADWICEHEMGTDAVFVTFCPGPLHRGGIIFELARVLLSESSPGMSARHDRDFRRVLINLVGTYGTDPQKRMLQVAFKEYELPYTAVRTRQNDGIT